MRWGLVVVAVFFLTACGDAVTHPQASAPMPQITINSHVGSRIIVNGEALTVTKAERKGTQIIADVTIESVDVPAAPYGPQYFRVRDAEGNTYPADAQSLRAGQLDR